MTRLRDALAGLRRRRSEAAEARRNRDEAAHCFSCAAAFDGDGPLLRTVDHRLARSRGGTDGLVNLVFACRACNERKADQPENAFAASAWLADRRRAIAGVATEGVATGGVSTGGVATGGVAGGGVAIAGVATEGLATGSIATEGVATGGPAREDAAVAGDEVDDAAVAGAMAVTDEFLATFNAGDAKAHAATLGYPHIRLASGTVRTWDSPADAVSAMAQSIPLLRDRAGWDHSEWDHRRVVHTGPGKVHLDVQFTRYRSDGSVIGVYPAIYIIVDDGGSWRIQCRSSFAP